MNTDAIRYKPLRHRLLASMILVPLAPFVMVTAIGGFYFNAAVQTLTVGSIQRTVGSHREMIDAFLDERKGDLELVLNTNPIVDLLEPVKLKAIFAHLQSRSSAFTDLGVFDASGTHVAYCGPYPLSGKVYKDAGWFRAVLNKNVYISDVFLGYRGVPHFIVAVARKESGVQWVLRATIDSRMFSRMVESVRIGKTGEAFIVNRQGFFQTERRSGGDLMTVDTDHVRYPAPHEGIQTFLHQDDGGVDYVMASTWLNTQPWRLVVRQEKADAFYTLRLATAMILLVSALGGVLIIAVAVYLTNRTVSRMERIDQKNVRLEQQFIGACRLAELGEMAAGFAHEINNPLQIMKSEKALIDTILSDPRKKSDRIGQDDLAQVTDSLDQIYLQINRCAKITQAILKFGRQGEYSVEELDLAEFIPEIISLIEKKAFLAGIRITERIAKNTPTVDADPAQMQQVFVNLCNNALDAIQEKHQGGDGELTIAAGAGSNGGVDIHIEDNGTGIKPENLENIFTPFFTTKPVGSGTGLGLSVCYGIVEKMGGKLTVESEGGTGTTVRMTIPAHGQ